MFSIDVLASANRIVAIAAHPDDIEIGCGGSLLALRRLNPAADVRWVVLTGSDERAAEARESARLHLGTDAELTQHQFRDGYLPYADPAAVKDAIVSHRDGFVPELVLAPRVDDAHQDHRFLGEVVGQVYRSQTILHYEIPKYDGDLGTVNLLIALEPADVDRKIEHLFAAFPSQMTKPWFDERTFRGHMRIRGVECTSSSGYAEGFVAPKIVLG